MVYNTSSTGGAQGHKRRSNWQNLPDEFVSTGVWAVATLKPILDANGQPVIRGGKKLVDKAPRHPSTGHLLDLRRPETWATFEECRASGYPALGRLLQAGEGFVVVDLDATEDAAVQAFQMGAFNEGFPGTYAERSQSGNGCHIVVRADLNGGYREDGVEVYGHQRYMIMTGDVIPGRHLPIARMQTEVDSLVAYIRKCRAARGDIDVNLPPDEDDERTADEIIAKAEAAKNGAKFKQLMYEEPADGADLSRLDASLAQMIAFYTRSHRLAVEVFSRSALWRGDGATAHKRGYERPEKYVYDYLLGRTFAKAWGHEAKREAEQVATAEQMKQALARQIEERAQPVTEPVGDMPTAAIDDKAANWAVPLDPRTAPGLIGFGTREHEQYRAKRQTPIPGYLAHLLAVSTIMGLGFRSTFKDAPDYANLQILALLPSLFGKEDIVSEGAWAMNLAKGIGMRLNFAMGYASSQAVHTAFNCDPYQCSLEDEAGRKAQQQRKGGGDPHQSGVVTFFMELFGRYFIPSRPYSNSENRKPRVPHAYATQLRLSQPETLAPTLDKANLTDGQLNRPYFIHEPKVPPKHPYGSRVFAFQSKTLATAYHRLILWSLPANQLAAAHADDEYQAAKDEKYERKSLAEVEPIPVVPTNEAEWFYVKFNDWCEYQVQAGFPIWGRAAQVAKRLAMVLAVGEAVFNVVSDAPPKQINISGETMKWACAEVAGRLRSLGLFAEEEIHGEDTDGRIAASVTKVLKKAGGRLLWSKLWNSVQKNTGEDTARVKRVILAMVEMERLLADQPIARGEVPKGTRLHLPR